MNGYRDPELDDVLQDEELRRIATMLSVVQSPEPPLDEAFRSALRRQLMQEAWAKAEGRDSWWRRAFAPPGLAWAGAAAGILLIASVVVFMLSQPPVGPFQLNVRSDLDGSRSVALQQPILVHFNQPMDHPSTESAVQITPATTVAFSWQENTLSVQPTSGVLAPNTQYQVTIGSGAKTASGQQLATPQTITFVTQPPTQPSPIPTPRPTPTSNSLLTGEKQLATLGGSTTAPVQWAADSSAIYYIDGKGALNVLQAKGGAVTVIAPDGASSPSVAPAGDQLAYIRSGKIEVLTFASGKTDELAVTPEPTLVGWSQTSLVWTAADGIYTQAANGSKQLARFPTPGVATPLSISADGTHVIYRLDQSLFVLDLTNGKSAQLGAAGATFAGWSPVGAQLLYGNGSAIVLADLLGNTQATLPIGDASWSSQDAILLGTDTDISQIRPDASGSTRLSNGTYRSPVWAPNGTLFAFFRGGALWVASAPAMAPEPTPLEQASAVVTSFMDARVKKQADTAVLLLDDSGKQAYEADGMHLVITSDPGFSRYYVLTQEMASTDPDTARFVVRLVLTHGKIDVSEFEETLFVVRDASTRKFFVHQATASSHRDLGKGAEVVAVDVAADTIKVTFDSDLDPGTIKDGVVLFDPKGKQVDTTASYAQRVVTLSGLNLKPGEQYKLVVLPTVRDVSGHNIANEYDLDFVGPSAKKHQDHKQQPVPSSASPSPSD